MTAVVMNLFYTGLGIARSLGEHGVHVIGLTAHRGMYGNFSRYAEAVRCADSRDDPETLLAQMIALGKSLEDRSVLFPTRDHDLVFIDRYRDELEPYFVPVIPARDALRRCLDKWETYRCAVEAGLPTPRTWLVEGEDDLRAAAPQLTYPCVLKPVAAYHWRAAENWRLVGGRKAISAASPDQLMNEYAALAKVDRRMLVQEQIPGGDDRLVVAACYLDRQGNFDAGFNVQKLVQVPSGFGTGCIVQSANLPELFGRTIRLLREMEFTGIAEVEYKRDASDNEYKLIEVNPRPWDQHRLGAAAGVDLVFLAYCDHAGLPKPAVHPDTVQRKWIAEDAFITAALQLLWRRDAMLGALLRSARGKKTFAIWSSRDPLPLLACLVSLIPSLARMARQALGRAPRALAETRHKPALRATQ